MKKLGIILAVLLVIAGLALFGLQTFLTKGLTTALNQRVFPSVKEMYDIELSVTNASVNLFKGTAELGGVAVRNLKGYEAPSLLTVDHCVLDVEMLSLLKRDPIIISLVRIEGATLIIEQNKDSMLNIKELADGLKQTEDEKTAASQQPAPQQTPTTETEVAPTKPIPVQIRRIAVNVRIQYTDDTQNKTYDMDLHLTGSDLFTVPAAGQPNSLLVLRGSMLHSKHTFKTDLSAILEPLIDLENPSFNASGSIGDIDTSLLGDLLEKNNMQSHAFSIKPSLTCAEGQFKDSYVDLELKDLKIYGAEAGAASIRIPIKGTLQNPRPEFPDLRQLILSEQGMKIGKTLGLRELKKQLRVDTNASPQDSMTDGLSNSVKEIANSPALGQLIQQASSVAQPTNSAETNNPDGAALVGQLDKTIKELEDNKELKKSLKNLGNSLLGR